MSKTKGFLAAVALAAIFTANAFAQDKDTAFVPFSVNVNATATARLAGAVRATKAVRASSIDTLLITTEGTTLARPGNMPNPVTMHSSRGKISLELSRQLYTSTDIALYSLNGKQVMHGKAAVSEAMKSMSHPDVAMGVYLLAVKGVNGNTFTTRFAHSGGGLNIDVAFANENSGSLLEKTIAGSWTITVSAPGYKDTSYAFVPETGDGNTPLQVITLREMCTASDNTDTHYCSDGTMKEYGVLIDNRDDQTYKTVVIGTQIWMAENLNYSLNIDSRCYENDEANCATYGRLYEWPTAMGSTNGSATGSDAVPSGVRGICPAGWHLPSRAEWEVMTAYVGGAGTAGKKLKAASGWDNGNGTDDYGFSALPGGRAAEANYFNFWDIGYGGYWWSTSSYYGVEMYSSGDNTVWDSKLWSINRYDSWLSVRCLQYPSSSSSIEYGSLTDSRDNQTYKTVVIGSQTWMAENLKYNAFGSSCYDDDPANCATYGRLYDWATAMHLLPFCNNTTGCLYFQPTQRGICPADWHVPSDEEWTALTDYVGSDAGAKLKTTGNDGTDEYGFSALMGGYQTVIFYGLGVNGSWWTSTEKGYISAYNRQMGYGNNDLPRGTESKTYKNSLRCLHDSSSVNSSSSGSSSSSSSDANLCADFVDGSKREHYGKDKTQFCDPRDGTVYVQEKIGSQTWMAENLKYDAAGSKCYGDYGGSVDASCNLPSGQVFCRRNSNGYCFTMSSQQCNDGYTPDLSCSINLLGVNCSPDGDFQANCAQYGRLYDWETAVNVCPAGWRLPSRAEWSWMTMYIGGKEDDPTYYYDDVEVASKLKAASGWNNNRNGTDEYGFSALPGGVYSGLDGYLGAGEEGLWWSENDGDDVNGGTTYAMRMHYDNSASKNFASWYPRNKSALLSVRCLQGDRWAWTPELRSDESGDDATSAGAQDADLYHLHGYVVSSSEARQMLEVGKTGWKGFESVEAFYDAYADVPCVSAYEVPCVIAYQPGGRGKFYPVSTYPTVDQKENGEHFELYRGTDGYGYTQSIYKSLLDCFMGGSYNKCEQGSVVYDADGGDCGGNKFWYSGYVDVPTVKCKTTPPGPSCGGVLYDPEVQYCSNGTLRNYGFLPYQGQTYKTVVIGTQTWMAENLNYDTTGSKCYDENPDYCDKYGRLYSHAAAMNVCPSGWHLPSPAEWNALSSYVESTSGCSNCASYRLKTKTYDWTAGINGGTDEYGFSALPGGSYSSTMFVSNFCAPDAFTDIGNNGSWWSTDSKIAKGMYYEYLENSICLRSDTDLRSVRCLQDTP